MSYSRKILALRVTIDPRDDTWLVQIQAEGGAKITITGFSSKKKAYDMAAKYGTHKKAKDGRHGGWEIKPGATMTVTLGGAKRTRRK